MKLRERITFALIAFILAGICAGGLLWAASGTLRIRVPSLHTATTGDLIYMAPDGTMTNLASTATTTVLVGGGAGVVPVWTTATGSGAPVRATSPTLVTPVLGVATGTSLALGGGTAITKIVAYAPTLTPVATAAAIQTVEQTFTVAGLATTDKVIVNGPVPTSLCPAVTFRVSEADTLAIGFTTLTAVACTPVAGVYNIIAIRN